MATRTTRTAGVGHTRATSLPPTGTYTVSMWAMLLTAPSDVQPFWYYNDASDTTWMFLGFDTSSRIYIESTGASGSGTQVCSLNQWYHIALTKNGSVYVGYLNGVPSVTFTDATSVTGATQFTLGGIKSGGSIQGTNHPNGRYCAVKIWDVALSPSEVARESMQYAPLRQTGLNSWFPMHTTLGMALIDGTGAGRHLVSNGTMTQEEGPAIPWMLTRKRVRDVPAAAVGGAFKPFWAAGSNRIFGGLIAV